VEVTEVRIKLMEEPGERLQAFCSITFDNCFVIRDLKIIEGTNGPFVAMPSRKLTSHCPKCGCKNHLRAGYCNQCGSKLQDDRAIKDDDGRAKLYADIAHPINTACREMIQEHVIKSFHEEIERSKQPGYVSSYDDFDDFDYTPRTQTREPAHRTPASAPHFDRKPNPAHGHGQNTGRSGPHRAPAPPTPQHVIPPAPQTNREQKAGGNNNSFGAGIF
jgi:stage V sporulation protein G